MGYYSDSLVGGGLGGDALRSMKGKWSWFGVKTAPSTSSGQALAEAGASSRSSRRGAAFWVGCRGGRGLHRGGLAWTHEECVAALSVLLQKAAIAGKDILVGEGIIVGERFFLINVIGDEIGEHRA